MDKEAAIIENFFGVYLLISINPKYRGRVYIGYTVDPNRRIKQHNKGKKAGGAWKTSKRGPWVMVMIIHGFPNDISALRFEWAWQHPHSSRRLHHVSKKKTKEKVYDFTLRVLSEMLLVGPWNRLPLTVRWLNQEFSRELLKPPPQHMPICNGAVISKRLGQLSQDAATDVPEVGHYCNLCDGLLEEKPLRCLNKNCSLFCHLGCLAKRFLSPGNYVPVDGKCPMCEGSFLWGDFVRKFRGCYQNDDLVVGDGDQFYSSESE